MSTANFSLPKLHTCLQDEIDAMTTLAELLKAEEAALVDGNVSELSRLTQDKSQLIMQLSKLENERKACLIQQGYSSDAKGMQDYFLKAATELSAAKDWEKLLHISEQAKEINRTNGVLINRQFNRNQSALNILQQNHPTGTMYGPNGQATNGSASGRGFIAG